MKKQRVWLKEDLGVRENHDQKILYGKIYFNKKEYSSHKKIRTLEEVEYFDYLAE